MCKEEEKMPNSKYPLIGTKVSDFFNKLNELSQEESKIVQELKDFALEELVNAADGDEILYVRDLARDIEQVVEGFNNAFLGYEEILIILSNMQLNRIDRNKKK